MLRRPRHNRSSICPTFGGALILKTHTMNNYRNTLTAAARVLSIMRDDAQREIEELENGASPTTPNQFRAAKYRREYASQALEAVLCIDPDEAKGAERYMRERL